MSGKINNIAEFIEMFPEVKEALIDGTENPSLGPKNEC